MQKDKSIKATHGRQGETGRPPRS